MEDESLNSGSYPDSDPTPSTHEFSSPNLGGRSMLGSSSSMHGDECGEPPRKSSRRAPPELHHDVSLTPTQREALERVVDGLDTTNTSVVVTNPLQKSTPSQSSRTAPTRGRAQAAPARCPLGAYCAPPHSLAQTHALPARLLVLVGRPPL